MDYEEIERLYKEARDKYDEAEKEFDRIHGKDKEFPDYSVFREYMKPYLGEMDKYRLMAIPCQSIKLSDFGDYGDYMSLEEFKKECSFGGFTDYDGCGALCIGKQKTDIRIYPSDIMKASPDLSKFDGIIWYNK